MSEEKEHSVYVTKFYSMQKQIDEREQEIERLNNSINELEKMMKNDLECACSMNENGLFNGAIDILEVYLDKLQELKEGNKK